MDLLAARAGETLIKLLYIKTKKQVQNVRHFTLNTTTETYFANGMLSGNYHTKPMASETFKFMK